MKVLPILIVLAGTLCVSVFASLPVIAATSPAMKACSQQWADMKKANKVPEGEKWSAFWSQCSKDFAAKNGGATVTEEKPSAEKPAMAKNTAAFT
jgi:Meckel syndrome type 1 protein